MAEYSRWSRGVHQAGDTCSHVEDPFKGGAEEEDTCADCLSGSPSSGGSSQNINGKGKKKKGKNKEKKVRALAHDSLLIDFGKDHLLCCIALFLKKKRIVRNISLPQQILLVCATGKYFGKQFFPSFVGPLEMLVSLQNDTYQLRTEDNLNFYKFNLQLRLLFSTSEIIACTLVNYTCKSFIDLTPGYMIVTINGLVVFLAKLTETRETTKTCRTNRR